MRSMAHKLSSTDWATWFLMAMAAILACVIIGWQIGIQLANTIMSRMH